MSVIVVAMFEVVEDTETLHSMVGPFDSTKQAMEWTIGWEKKAHEQDAPARSKFSYHIAEMQSPEDLKDIA